MSMFLHLVSVVLFLGFLSLIFVGVGLLCRLAFGFRTREIQDVLTCGWVGWALTVALLQIWHLCFPVNDVAFVLVAAIGLIGLFLGKRDLGRLVWGRRRVGLVMILAAVVVAAWVANFSIKQPGIYDTGLYHLNVVKWNSLYGIVPGLGNLHGRLGYNNASLLYSALLDIGPFEGRSHHVASAWLMLWALLRCLFAFYELFKPGGQARVETMYYALLATPLCVWIVNTGYASSHSPDVGCFMLALVVGGELLAMNHFEGVRGNPARSRFLNIILLSVVGVVVKLSFLVFGAIACAIALLVLISNADRSTRVVRRSLIVAVVLASMVVLPWMVRGVILTGYPAYPVEVLRVERDWTVSVASCEAMVQHVKAWARAPGIAPELVGQSSAWLRPWLERVLAQNKFEIAFPLMTVFLAALIFGFGRKNGAPPMEFRRCALLCLPGLLGVVFWFLSAPDPRFLGSISWVLAASMLVLALQHRRQWALPLVVGHAAMLLAGGVNMIDVVRSYKDSSPAKEVDMIVRETNSGLTVFVPQNGDQCWDADLPCTPYFSPLLTLRDPRGVEKGFIKVGARQ
ncbi:MAG: hypothetical protein OSB41_11910 [Kiritimatiellae bacterium]|nr:hypothetical protein [Kiritimatiellia bacterium]